MQVLIFSRPPGDAPEWVREALVGLVVKTVDASLIATSSIRRPYDGYDVTNAEGHLFRAADLFAALAARGTEFARQAVDWFQVWGHNSLIAVGPSHCRVVSS